MSLMGVAAGSLISLVSAQSVVGDVPEYKFREPLVDGQGVESLADLQGKPVLVEFWGTR